MSPFERLLKMTRAYVVSRARARLARLHGTMGLAPGECPRAWIENAGRHELSVYCDELARWGISNAAHVYGYTPHDSIYMMLREEWSRAHLRHGFRPFVYDIRSTYPHAPGTVDGRPVRLREAVDAI